MNVILLATSILFASLYILPATALAQEAIKSVITTVVESQNYIYVEADKMILNGTLKPIPEQETYHPAYKHVPPTGWTWAQCPRGQRSYPTDNGINCR